MAAREIKFRDHCGNLVGRQNGMVFLIRTEPGVIAGTPAHWVTVVLGGEAPNFSTVGHQYFHLDEAKEFCRQIAAGEINLAVLRAQYDAEDEARIRDEHQISLSELYCSAPVWMLRGCPSRSCWNWRCCTVPWERWDIRFCWSWSAKKSPGRVEAPPGRVSCEAYHENMSIVPAPSR